MISIAQPRILDYNNQDKYEYAGASGGYLDFLGYPFCRGRILADLSVESETANILPSSLFWAILGPLRPFWGAYGDARGANFGSYSGFFWRREQKRGKLDF